MKGVFIVIINNDNLDILFRRLDELYDQVSRIRVCLKAVKEGKDFDMDFEDEIYTETAQEKSSITSHAALTMEHILKMKYCTNNRNYDVWWNSVTTHVSRVVTLTKYFKKKRNEDFIKHYEETFNEAYEDAIDAYKVAAISHDDLKVNQKYIPEKYPWQPDDLILKPLWWLLNKLPDPDDITTQMQLYPFCKYNGDYTSIRNKQCVDCDKYAECISNYYDKNTRD